MKIPLVSEVHKLHSTASISVDEDASLEVIINKFSKRPSLRGVFLVNSEKIFTGMITRIDLIKWIHLQILGGQGMGRVPISEIVRLLEARKAKELALSYKRSVSVQEKDDIQKALNLMLNNEEDIIPVLNDQGRILGDLRLSEILQWFLAEART